MRCTPRTAFRSTASTRGGRLGGVRPAGSEPLRVGAVGRRRQAVHDAEVDPGGRRLVRARPAAGSVGQDAGFPDAPDGGRALDCGHGRSTLRGAAGQLRRARTRRSGRSRRPPSFKPPAERHAGADRGAAQAVRERASNEKEPANDGARRLRRDRRTRTTQARGRRPRAARRSTPAATSTGRSSGLVLDAHRRAIWRAAPSAVRSRQRSSTRCSSSAGRGAQARASRSRRGWRVAMQAMLVSPDFLFRIERDSPATA